MRFVRRYLGFVFFCHLKSVLIERSDAEGDGRTKDHDFK